MTLENHKLTLTKNDITAINRSRTERLKIQSILQIMCNKLSSDHLTTIIVQLPDTVKTITLRRTTDENGDVFTVETNETKITCETTEIAIQKMMLYAGIMPLDDDISINEMEIITSLIDTAYQIKLVSRMIDSVKSNYDVTTEKQAYVEEMFNRHCQEYGLNHNDLHKRYVNPLDEIIEITGIEPRNRKYKILVYNHTTDSNQKATPAFVTKYCKPVS